MYEVRDALTGLGKQYIATDNEVAAALWRFSFLKDGEAAAQAARYTGRVDGKTLTLTVTLADTGRVVGTFTLTRGSSGRLFKCLR